MIILARKIQIIFVNHKQLILMGSKDSKLMKTWAWDRRLSRNCRGFCLGQHREIINFTVLLLAKTNWWFKEKKKAEIILASKCLTSISLTALLSRKYCPSSPLWLVLSFRLFFSWQPLFILYLWPDATRADGHQYSECPGGSFWVQTAISAAVLPSKKAAFHVSKETYVHFMLPSNLSRRISCLRNVILIK